MVVRGRWRQGADRHSLHSLLASRFLLANPLAPLGSTRSLIALSLILALLQFKPAPMYILDEVDAALDLSHTQNIGRLIKTRFQGSQFIVVSLKDGMFQNANRVFRTRFSEGTSVVSVMTPGELK